MLKKSLLAVCLSVSLSASCGGDTTSPTDLSGVCNANDGIFVGFVDLSFECSPLFEFLIARPTAAEISTGCNGALQPFIDDGTVTVNQTAVADCQEWLAGRTCDTVGETPNPCDDIFIGTRALGESCDDDAQCVGQTYCNMPSPGCGTCGQRAADGGACKSNQGCTSGDCDVDTNTCVSPGSIGDTCADDFDCEDDLICTGSACAAEPTWSQGVACQKFDACGWPNSGLYCGQSMQCETVNAVGDACADFLACDLIGGVACDFFDTGLCITSVEVASGADCAPFFGTHCAASQVCVSDGMGAQTCQDPLMVGDACVDNCGASFFLECVADMCQLGSHTGMCPAP